MSHFDSVEAVLEASQIPKSHDPRRILVVHDTLKDLDDTLAGVAEAGLHHAGQIEVVGALGVLNPALRRACAIKGGFVELGLPEILVGEGSDITDTEQAFGHETCSYLAPKGALVVNGFRLIYDMLHVSRVNLDLVICAGMTDIAQVMRDHPVLADQGLGSVTIMGGVKVSKVDDGYEVALDAEGYMTPDTAANNAFDPEAARIVYRFCQERDIPLTVLTREAAYACQVNLGEFLNRMAATGSPIGSHLVNAQAPSLRNLFQRSCQPAGSMERGTLPARCDRAWFVNTFCGGRDPGEVADIWPHVTAGQAYDLMAVLAAIPDIRNRFFAPVEVVINGLTHRVIGLNKDWHDGEVADVDGLREFMHELCVATLAQYQRRTA